MSKPCNECPFVESTKRVGAPDWLEDVLVMHQANPYFSHSCHITDPKADGFKGGKKRECIGHSQMMMNEIDGTPGLGGVYKSIRDMAARYLKDWGVNVGDAELK